MIQITNLRLSKEILEQVDGTTQKDKDEFVAAWIERVLQEERCDATIKVR
jgi:hypothetical protein